VNEDTETYYRRRWEEETDAADRATDPVAADVHRSLAERYLALCGEPQRRSIDGERVLDMERVRAFPKSA
jgi:hypothetical protein